MVRTPTKGGAYAAAISAFVIWGLFPIYLIGLLSVSAMELTAHRIVWSFVFVLAWLAVLRQLNTVWAAFTNRAALLRLSASAFFIAVNWIGFAWAVNQGHVLEVSLAYFMGPLLNILLGVFVLSERLRRPQWVAVGFAAAGVAYLTLIAGHPPWIALMVGSSFALYGLIRKTVSIDALPGLAVEVILLVPFAAAYLVWLEWHGVASFTHKTFTIDALLLFGGIITSVPLVLFAYGARQVPLSTIGIMQFIAPSMQLVCALLVFKEPLAPERLNGFVLIWIGLSIYAAEALWRAWPRVSTA